MLLRRWPRAASTTGPVDSRTTRLSVEHPRTGDLPARAEEGVDGEGAELLLGLGDRGQAGIRVRGELDVVDTDHGEVLRHAPPGEMGRPQGRHGGKVVVGNHAEGRLFLTQEVSDRRLPTRHDGALGRQHRLGPEARALQRTAEADETKQARSDVRAAKVGEFAVAELEQVLGREHARPEVVELDMAERLLDVVRSESGNARGRPVLEVVEEPVGHGEVPVDDADVQPVVHRLAQEVRAAGGRHGDELADLLGEEDFEGFGLQACSALGYEEQRLEAESRGRGFWMPRTTSPTYPSPTLWTTTPSNELDFVRNRRAAADGRYCSFLAVLSTAARLAALMAVSPVSTRLTVAVETPAAAATSLIVTGFVTTATNLPRDGNIHSPNCSIALSPLLRARPNHSRNGPDAVLPCVSSPL